MRAVDTNVLVRILVRDAEEQVELAETFIANGAWISHIVLVEAIWVLNWSYRFSRDELARSIEMLLKHEHFVLQDADLVSNAVAQFRAKSSISFSDCLIFETARRAGHLPFGTFDRRLGQLPGTERLK